MTEREPGWRLVALTYEQTGPDAWVLVVRHEFYGDTEERAREVFASHLRADAFLRGCTATGKYGTISCRTVTHLERRNR